MPEKTIDEIIASFKKAYHEPLEEWLPLLLASDPHSLDLALQIKYLILRQRANNFSHTEINYLYLATSDATNSWAKLLRGDLCFYKVLGEASNAESVKSAKAYYQSALAMKNDFAHLALGILLEEKNEEAKAITHYEMVEEKYLTARFQLGAVHWLTKTDALALYYLEQANSIPHSQYILGKLKEKESGLKTEKEAAALAMYQQAAAGGSVSSLLEIGTQYLKGNSVVNKDLKIAIKCFTACQQAGVNVYLSLADAYIADQAYAEAISHLCEAYLLEPKIATLEKLIDVLDNLKVDKNKEPDPRVRYKTALMNAADACKWSLETAYVRKVIKAIRDFPEKPEESLFTVRYRTVLIKGNWDAFTVGFTQDPEKMIAALQCEWLPASVEQRRENELFFKWANDLVQPLVKGKKKTLVELPNWAVAWLLIKLATVSLIKPIPAPHNWMKGQTFGYIKQEQMEKEPTDPADDALLKALKASLAAAKAQLAIAIKYLNAIPNDPKLKPHYMILPESKPESEDHKAVVKSSSQSKKVRKRLSAKQFGSIVALYKNAGEKPTGIFSEPHPPVKTITPYAPTEPYPNLQPLWSGIEPHPPAEQHPDEPCPPDTGYSYAPLIWQAPWPGTPATESPIPNGNTIVATESEVSREINPNTTGYQYRNRLTG